MNSFAWFWLLFLSIVAIIAIIQDYRYRKVTNQLTLPLILLGISWYLYAGSWNDMENLFLAVVSVIAGYLLFVEGIWGGADGKLFIAFSLVLLGFSTWTYAVSLMVLMVSYALTIWALVMIKTTGEQKRAVFTQLDLLGIALQSLLVVVLMALLFRVLGISWQAYLFFSALLLVKLAAINLLVGLSRRYIDSLSFTFRIAILVLALGIMVVMEGYWLLAGVGILTCIRVIAEWTGNMTDIRGQDISSPSSSAFSGFLFLAAILSLLVTQAL